MSQGGVENLALCEGWRVYHLCGDMLNLKRRRLCSALRLSCSVVTPLLCDDYSLARVKHLSENNQAGLIFAHHLSIINFPTSHKLSTMSSINRKPSLLQS